MRVIYECVLYSNKYGTFGRIRSPEDEYNFVRVEDSPEVETPQPATPPAPPVVEPVKAEDEKSEVTEVSPDGLKNLPHLRTFD